MRVRPAGFLLAAALVYLTAGPRAEWGQTAAPAATIEHVINALTFRNIGPFRAAAWVTEVAVPGTPARDHLYTIDAATRSGVRERIR